MFSSNSRSQSRAFLRCGPTAGRGFLYLLEPLLVAIVVVLMLTFVPRQPAPAQPRLAELHGQDILAIIQKDGALDSWTRGNATLLETDLGLIRRLDPNYKYYFFISGQQTFERGSPLKGITVRRTFVAETPLLIELTLSH